MAGVFSTLGTGSGALRGLEALLARRLTEAKFEEDKRKALAAEAFDERQLQEQSALRRAMQESTDLYRQGMLSARNEGLDIQRDRDERLGQQFSASMKAQQDRYEASQQQHKLDQEALMNRFEQSLNQRERLWGQYPVPIQGPYGTTLVPRGSVQFGAPAPFTGSQEEKISAYRDTLSLIDDLNNLVGPSENWRGVGPIAGTFGAAASRYLGPEGYMARLFRSGGAHGEQLRTKLNQLKARASFQEGGKQFTGTERALLEAFLATVEQDPVTARLRLNEFQRSAQRSLANMLRGIPQPIDQQNAPAPLNPAALRPMPSTPRLRFEDLR